LACFILVVHQLRFKQSHLDIQSVSHVCFAAISMLYTG